MRKELIASDAAENSIMQTITIAVSAILIAAGLVTAPGLINNARDNNATTDLANLAYAQEYNLSNQGSYRENVVKGEPNSLYEAVRNTELNGERSGVAYTLSNKVSNHHALVCAPGEAYLLRSTSSSQKTFFRASTSGKTSSNIADLNVPECITNNAGYYDFIGSSRMLFNSTGDLGEATVNKDSIKSLGLSAPADDPAKLSVTSGSLPTGMEIAENEASIEGAPTQTGRFKFRLLAVNSAQRVASPEYTMDVVVQPNMTSVWNTTMSGCNVIKLPISGTTNVTVDWGDGTVQDYTTAYPSHTYTQKSTATAIKIDGKFQNYGAPSRADAVPSSNKCLVGVTNWGETGTTNAERAFAGAYTMTGTPTSVPSTITSMYGMFSDAWAFNSPNVSSWNTSNVTDFSRMFVSNLKFNQDISSWDTSKVTDMKSMFYNASVFNQDISGWNTSNVTNMWGTFGNARAFNQNISGWNTAKVDSMNETFSGAVAFNQNLSGWNVDAVTFHNNFALYSGIDGKAELLPKFKS
jgi:surface protein